MAADTLPTQVTIRPGGTDSEGLQSFFLEWSAVSNAVYKIQTRDGFEPGTEWKTFDVVLPTGNLGIFKITPEKVESGSEQARRGFVRLVVPAPEIFSVEPARFAAGAMTEVYILGQCFGSNDMVYFAGVAQTNRVIVSPSLIMVNVRPSTPGTYEFELR